MILKFHIFPPSFPMFHYELFKEKNATCLPNVCKGKKDAITALTAI